MRAVLRAVFWCMAASWTARAAAGGVTLDGAQAVLALDDAGRAVSLRERATGRELLAAPTPFVSVVRAGGASVAACRLERRADGALAFSFPGGAGEAVLRAEPVGKGDGWSFTLASLAVPEAATVRMGHVRPVCATWCGTMANALSDERSAVALRAYDLGLAMSASRNGGLLVRSEAGREPRGLRFGLVAGPRDGFVAQLRALSRASGAPLSDVGGAWSLGTEACRGSYLFADLSRDSVDDWIDLAERGGFRTLHIHGWWRWLGHSPVDTNRFPRGLADMKATVDRIHAAGLQAGMHSLTACIDPYRDPWITPVCSTSLVADATYTLAAPLAADATEIRVAEPPVAKHDLVFTYASNGNFLRLGHEVVQYAGVRREPPFAFTGCRRGFFGTTPAAHPAGARCDYLHQRYIAFYPDPDSPLADDLAARLARVRNVCGIDAFYFDGSEGMGTRYGIDRMRHLVFWKFARPPVVEASCWGAHNWWFHSRIGAWDHAVWGARRFHDAHLRATVDEARRANFMEPQLGWWQPRVGSARARGHFPEEMEYFAGKNAGFDVAMSQQGVNVTGGPASEFLVRQFTLLGWYERARLARAFTPAARARLAAPRAEARLRQGADGVWTLAPVTSVVRRVSEPSAREWRFTLPRAAEGTLRVEALYDAARNRAGTNLLTAADAPQMALRTAPGLRAAVAGVGQDGLRLAATNTAPAGRAAPSWVGAVRTYPFPYRDLGEAAAFTLRVKGDGSGAVLNLQLEMAREYHGALCEHYVTLDFTGWRDVTLLARERDADAFADLAWPYGAWPVLVHRNPYDGRHVKAVSLWLNGVPAGGGAAVEVADLRAAPTAKPVLKGASVTVNGRRFAVPFALEAGEYAELEDGAWIRYSERGESLARVAAREAVRLAAGTNRCAFASAPGGGTRAEVTILARGAAVPAFGPLTAEQRGALAYEAMRPFVHAPAQGFDATPRLTVRPGETAQLEVTVLGPATEPAFDFGARGRVVFPVALTAGERLVCRDGRNWRVLAAPRRERARGALARPLPLCAGGLDWTFSTSGVADRARVEVVKRYVR